MEQGPGWNPWATLKARPDVRLEYRWLPRHRGRVVEEQGAYTITLDAALGRVERRCVLAHELCHIEMGELFRGGEPKWQVRRAERRVDDEVARRMVPLGDLVEFVELMMISDDAVTPAIVAEEYDVTERVARDALLLLRRRLTDRLAG